MYLCMLYTLYMYNDYASIQSIYFYLLAVDEVQNSCPELLLTGRASHGADSYSKKSTSSSKTEKIQSSSLSAK